MSATIIDRTNYNALADDSGGNLDGTFWTKNQVKTVLLDAIDAMFSGASTFAFGGAVACGTYNPTNTGTKNDWDIDTDAGVTVGHLYCNNGSALTITGLKAPSSNRFLWITSIGAGTITITEQDTGSTTAGDRIITGRGSLILPAGTGACALVYDVTTARWRVRWTRGVQAPQCRAYNSAVQSIANTTTTALTFDSDDYDVGGMHDTSSNTSRVTVPTGMGGTYLIVAQTLWAANSTGVRRLSLRKNGSTILQENDAAPASATRAVGNICTSIQQLSAADYVEAIVFQESGGSLNAGDTSSGTANALMMIRLSD